MKTGKNVISPLRSLGETSLLEGNHIMTDIIGPYMVKARPNSNTQTINRSEKVKVHILITLCLYSHRVYCAVLDSMHTSSLTGALHQIVLKQVWRPSELSFDAGSSLIPAASQAARGIHDGAGEDREDDSDNQHELDQEAAEEVVRNLKETGYKLKVPRAKASYRQSNIESTIREFKKRF